MDKATIIKALKISALFTFIDFLVHYFYAPLAITFHKIEYLQATPLINYAIGKIIFSSIIIFLLLSFMQKNRKLLIPLILSGLLAISYYYYGGYADSFHIYNFINHFAILYGIFYAMEKGYFNRWL